MKEKDLLIAVEHNVGRTQARIGFYNTATGEPSGSVQVGYYPHELVLSGDLNTIYSANYGFLFHDRRIGVGDSSISVIDVASRSEKYRLYPFKPEERKDYSDICNAPHDVRLRPPLENQLFVNYEIGNKLVVFDLMTRELIKEFDVKPVTHKFSFSPDGNSIWTMGLGWQEIIQLDADTGAVIGEIKLGTGARALTSSHDNCYILVACINEIIIIDTKKATIYKRFSDLGVGDLLYSEMTHDGKYLIVPACLDNLVLIIDIESGFVRKLATGIAPITAKVSTSGDCVYVTHWLDAHVTKINLDTFNTVKIPTGFGLNGLALIPYVFPKKHKKMTLGVALPLTGKDGLKGKEMMFGYEFWALQVRNAGGLWAGGEPYDLQIIYLDTESHESKLEALTIQLIKEFSVNLLLPTYGTSGNEVLKRISISSHTFLVPSSQIEGEIFQPTTTAVGKDYFITSKNFAVQFKAQYQVFEATVLTAIATSTCIRLQQALLIATSLDFDAMNIAFTRGKFNTFLS